jgi:hypothetical protein
VVEQVELNLPQLHLQELVELILLLEELQVLEEVVEKIQIQVQLFQAVLVVAHRVLLQVVEHQETLHQ